MDGLTDAQLRGIADELRWQAQTGTPLKSLLIESYALVRQASRRITGMQHFPVQLMGGIALFEGHVAEMQTGEGKTLTAVLASFLRALPGKGCHVVTVNDYLAGRDKEKMGPISEMLGLTVGCIQSEMQDDERRAAYQCDITYGTAKELGFDFLRDRLKMENGGFDKRRQNRAASNATDQQLVQRGHYFALVDEADSIFIDEARTPLIIGLTQPNSSSQTTLLRWCHRVSKQLKEEVDYIFDTDHRCADLTDEGCRNILLMAKPSLLNGVSAEEFYTHVEKALTADLAFQRDRDYVVDEEEVVIVDESTGRMMHGRKWQEGLHQAVEAKEMLPITPDTAQAARVTIQRFFRQYKHLAGMTGTAATARRELAKSYKLKVSVIPTHRKCLRAGMPSRVFISLDAKWAAVVETVVDLHQSGRAVLIGTPSVRASESLGERLQSAGIPHRILNARYHEVEAEIVSEAGQPGRVTIATNMAGRGTDILLAEAVRVNGGVHVIATEMHSSQRIDRQLIGRAARQGDPGSFQFLVSLEDELLRGLPPERVERLKKQAGTGNKGELPRDWLSVFKSTQSFLEKTHRKQRKALLKQEDSHKRTYENMGLDPFTELTDEGG